MILRHILERFLQNREKNNKRKSEKSKFPLLDVIEPEYILFFSIFLFVFFITVSQYKGYILIENHEWKIQISSAEVSLCCGCYKEVKDSPLFR